MIRNFTLNCFFIFSLQFAYCQSNLEWLQFDALYGEAGYDKFGKSVAINNSGNIMAIGGDYNDGNGTSAGHVRVFQRINTSWVQMGSDIDGENSYDYSGGSIDINSQGNRIAIGAKGNDGNGSTAGHVRVYEWSGSSWVQMGSDIDGEAADDLFGSSVEMNSSGNRIVVGAYMNSHIYSNYFPRGHVRVYEWSGSSWVQMGSDIDGDNTDDYFGLAVSMNSTGDKVLIGAIGNDDGGNNAGQVKIFQWNGTTWIQQGQDINGEAAGDYSGREITMNAAGDRIAIGAPSNDGNGSNSGHVRIFYWNGTNWMQQGQDLDGDNTNYYFGGAVSMNSTGDKVVIGVPGGGGGNNCGQVKIFQWNGATWIQQGQDINGEAACHQHGYSIDLNGDGDTLIVGSPSSDLISNSITSVNIGKASLFRLCQITYDSVVYSGCNYVYNNITYDTTGTYTDTLVNASGCDSIVYLDLTITNSYYTDVQQACSSFTWINGNTYTSSTNGETHTLINSLGCDSVVTLDLTILNSTSSVDSQIACDSYTWIDGNTYTSSTNGLTHTLINSVGCDSVVTLNLTILNPTTFVDTKVACDSYTWIDGNTYTSSTNGVTHTLINSVGCDSIVILNLTINSSTTGVDNQVACDSYTWIDGNTYTSNTNGVTHTLINSLGCDSIVTLNLTINSSTTGVDIQVACDSYTWINGNTYTGSTNGVTHTLINSLGCDSVVTLDLTILNSTSGVDSQIACDSYTWIDGNTYTSSTNGVTHTLINSVGCDSLVTLDLTINNSSSNAISYCGANADLSCVSSNQVTIGSSSSYNSSTGWPAPFGNYYKNARQQFLYKAAELNAMGIYRGKITNIAWQTLYSNSSTSTFYDYSIKMGCTQSNSLSSSWETGLFTVYQPKTFVVNSGWNQLDFDTAYEWNGVSNLVVEICYDNLNYNYTNNWSTPYENTPFNSSSVYYSDINYTCSSTAVSSLLSNRPITKFNICSSSFYPPVFACDQYTWINGQTYYNSNSTASHTLINSVGCDSLVGLNLTVGQSDFVVDLQVACNSYTWIDGNTYTTNNNSATHILTNSTGCDSVVQLDLTIHTTNNSVDQLTGCDSYTWINGVTYTSSNNSAVYTTTNIGGCDSIVSLDLTINYSSTSNDVITACGSYTWINGVTYTSNGSALYIVPNNAGCDSTIFLDLTINQVQTGILNNSPTLSALASNAVYQWLNCSDGFAEIPGETNQDFTASNNGSFAVEVTQNNCTDTSLCESINNVNIVENTFDIIPILFPNPSKEIVNVDFRNNVKNLIAEIYDLQGKKINEYTYDEAILIKIDVSDYERGIYEIRLVANNPKAYAKLKLIKM